MKKELLETALSEIRTEYLEEAMEPMPTDKNQSRAGKKRRLLWLPAAVIGLLLCVTFSAAAWSPVDLQTYLGAVFRDGYELLDDMVSMPEYVSYHASGDEIKLELRGILGDSQAVMIFFDLTAAPEVELPEAYVRYTVDIDAAWYLLPSYRGSLGWYGAEVLERTENEDGSVTQKMCVMFTSEALPLGKPLVLTLRGLDVLDPQTHQAEKLVSGKWQITFPLDYKDTTKVIPVDAMLEAAMCSQADPDAPSETLPLHISEVRLSPLSVMIKADTDAEISDTEFDRFNLRTAKDGVLLLSDCGYEIADGKYRIDSENGTWWEATEEEIAVWEARNRISGMHCSSSVDTENGRRNVTWIFSFTSQIDPEAVTALCFGDAELPLS